MDQIQFAFSDSREQRARILEKSAQLEGKERFDCIVAMLATPFHDLWEAVLDSCTPQEIESWRPHLISLLADFTPKDHLRQVQGLLVLIQRIDGKLEPEFVQFYRSCLHIADTDVQYQAFCIAELQEESSQDYIDFVRKSLQSSDVDFRIVAVQALTRLKPDWACDELEKLLHSAQSLEYFHILLAMVRLVNTEEREKWVLQLSPYLANERYCFAAIQSISDYGVSGNIPALLSVARSFMAEPTNRVAAAAAAAKLGSDEGFELLEKFSQSRHGNPNYARELIGKLNQRSG